MDVVAEGARAYCAAPWDLLRRVAVEDAEPWDAFMGDATRREREQKLPSFCFCFFLVECSNGLFIFSKEKRV